MQCLFVLASIFSTGFAAWRPTPPARAHASYAVLEGVIGAMPIAGDAFDVFFRAVMRAFFAVRYREPDTPDVKNKRNARHYRGCLIAK